MEHDYFTPGWVYVHEIKQPRTDRYQVVKADRIDDKVPGKPYFYVDLIGFWIPPDKFSFKDVQEYPILLLDFSPEDWRKLSEDDMLKLTVEQFTTSQTPEPKRKK